jgi:hypothetical protein
MGYKSFLLACFIISIGCNSGDKKVDQVAYNKSKESLAEKEKSSPLSFLTISGTDKKNLVGQTVIKGLIKNNATVCAYKDVRVKMLFYKDGTLVANHEQVMEEAVKANNDLTFKSRYKTPKGTDSVALSIMSAAVLEDEK